MISLADILKLVFRYALEKKGRVFLTISGIIIGIFTFTFFLFASQGLSNAISEQFSSFGVNVLGVRLAGSSQAGPEGEGLTDTDIAKIKQVISNYKYVSPLVSSQFLYEYGRTRVYLTTVSYPDEYIDEISTDLGVEIGDGRNLRPGDGGVVVLGAKIAKDGFGKDTNIQVGNSIKINDKSFRVVGIIKERGDLFLDNGVLMGFDDIQDLAEQDTYSTIRISFYEGTDLDEMQKNIERKLNPSGKEKRVEVTSPTQILEQVNMILGALTMIISFVSGVALLVGGINVMNTMHANVVERKNEISVMKAIGATNHDILRLFLIESSFLGFVGAFLGFIMAYGFAELLSYLITNFMGYNVPVYFDFTLFMIIVFVTTMFAIAFGTYPAIHAARVQPGDNLRDD